MPNEIVRSDQRMTFYQRGVTLLEMMLVLVVISSMVYMGITYYQRDIVEARLKQASMQMQQIMNAAAAYYVVNNTWPSSVASLQTGSPQYLPNNISLKSPWGNYSYVTVATTKNFYVYIRIATSKQGLATIYAGMLRGRLPIAYLTGAPTGTPPQEKVCLATATTCYVVAQIPVPPQNINKAFSVNFAGLYHHGGCIPVPQCKVDGNGTTMVPQVFVTPVSVSGMNDPGNVYPISSFTAYATAQGSTPPACTGGTAVSCAISGTPSPSGQYWRACLQVISIRGNTATTNTNWGQYVTLGAFTRCAATTEPMSGSDFSVFSN